jgi:hypothetical protein
VLCRQHAADRRLALGCQPLEGAAPVGNARRLGAHLPGFGLDAGQRAVGLRDGALGVAQGVARLAPGAFLALELLLQRLDARAQRLQVFAPRLRLNGERRAAEDEKKRADQAFAFPWAATAAMRRAISSASPRYWRRIGFSRSSSS